MVVSYETGDVKAITALCKVVDKYFEEDEILVKFQKINEYERTLDWKLLKNSEQLEDCQAVHFHRGTIFKLEKRHYETIVNLLQEINVKVPSEEALYRTVKQAMMDDKKKDSRLENRKSIYPEINKVTTKINRRNPDVIAAV